MALSDIRSNVYPKLKNSYFQTKATNGVYKYFANDNFRNFFLFLFFIFSNLSFHSQFFFSIAQVVG